MMFRKLVGILLGVFLVSIATAQKFSIFYIASPNGTLTWCRCPDDPFGGLPRRASAIKKAQRAYANPLIFDTGDLLAPFPSHTKDSIFIKAYLKIPLDAVAFGDQELIDGYDFFASNLKTKLPFVSLNIYRNDKRLLKPYIVKERAGRKIVITSLFNKDAFLFYDKANLGGVNVHDADAELRAMLPELLSKGEVLVLISHLGFEEEKRIAEKFPDIDIIVSGHAPAKLQNPLRVGKTFILGSGPDAKHFGLATFDISSDSLVLVSNKVSALTNDYAEDPAIQKIVAPYIEADDVVVDSTLLVADTVVRQVSSKHFPVPIDVFYAPDCDHCIKVLKVTMPRLAKRYPGLFTIKLHNIDIEKEYLLLESNEEKYNDLENDLPVFFFEGHVLGGEEEINTNLEKMLLKARPNYSTADSSKYSSQKLNMVLDSSLKVSSDTSAAVCEKREIVFFETFGCKECDRVKYMLKIITNDDSTLTVNTFPSDDPHAKELLTAMGVVYNIPENKRLLTPVIFYGHDYLQKSAITLANIKKLIASQKDNSIPWEKINKVKQQSGAGIVEQFENFSLLPIIGAGLLDGINPCAFATLIFFITYLSVLGVERKKIIWIAIPFIISVFLTYLILGFIAYQILAFLQAITLVSQIVFAVTILFLLFLAGLTFYDYILLKKGRGDKMKLKLPVRIRQRINKMIRKRTAFGGFILGAVLTGFLVSLFELICTGQVYLPTLIYVVQVSEKWVKALFYLIIYNLAFILPLVVVFILVRFGLTEKHLQRFLTKRAGLTKILTGILFLMLAGVMAYLLIRGLM